jgi:hypothetical protein
MSSSYRKSARIRVAVNCAVAAAAALPVSMAWGAQTYVQPRVDVRVENNDNFDLDPNGTPEGDIYGFIVDAQTLVGIFTERSETSVRPRLKFQEYPDRDDLQRIEAFLDLRSRYNWERSEFLMIGRYALQDSYNVETPDGVFDPLDPNFGNNADSSTVLVGETRQRLQLNPTYDHSLTERVKLGVGLNYETVSYDADVGEPTRIDYDFTVVDGSLSWALSPQSKVGVGAYASQFKADDDSEETDAYGGGVGYSYNWSEVTGVEARLFYESNDVTVKEPVRIEESTSGWGGSLTAYHKLEVSDWRFAISRTYIPTGDGGKSESDLLRLQYNRSFSERLSFLGAARYEMRNALTETGGGDDRDYARVDLSLNYYFTQTWYVQGGYSYTWLDRQTTAGDADNNRLFVSVGYQGLRRQRR